MKNEFEESEGKTRNVIESRAREMLMSVNDYFEKEKEQTKNILKTLNSLLKDDTDNSEIAISRQLLLEITYHLKKNNSITECVAKATGVNKNTVCTVRGERRYAEATGSKLETPTRKPRGKKQRLDSSKLLTLRNIIHSFSMVNETPTLKKILAVAQRDLDFKGSKSTLHRIIKDDLGYHFKKNEQQEGMESMQQ